MLGITIRIVPGFAYIPDDVSPLGWLLGSMCIVCFLHLYRSLRDPGSPSVPGQAVTWLLRSMEWLGNKSRDFWNRALAYVNNLTAAGRHVIIAGHSFGTSVLFGCAM